MDIPIVPSVAWFFSPSNGPAKDLSSMTPPPHFPIHHSWQTKRHVFKIPFWPADGSVLSINKKDVKYNLSAVFKCYQVTFLLLHRPNISTLIAQAQPHLISLLLQSFRTTCHIPRSHSHHKSRTMATSSKSTNTNLYLTTLTAYQTASLFGYSVGFIGGLLVLPSFLTHFHLSSLPPSALAAAQARIVTLWLVGALFGVPIGIPICSTYGRKAGLRMSALLYVLGASLQVSGYRGVQGFEVGRAVNGLGVGVGTLVSPLL